MNFILSRPSITQLFNVIKVPEIKYFKHTMFWCYCIHRSQGGHTTRELELLKHFWSYSKCWFKGPGFQVHPNKESEIGLSDENQKYLFAVFEKVLQEDQGKALVCNFMNTYDSQSGFRDLRKYATISTQTSLEESSKLSYTTTVWLGDGSWKCTTHALILHLQSGNTKL